MKEGFFAKLFLWLGLSVVIGFFGLGAAFFVALAVRGGQMFYAPLLMIIAGGLIVFCAAWIFNWLRPKWLTVSLFGFLVLCGIAAAGHELNQSYIKSLGSVNEQGVNLEEYAPFAPETKAAALEGPSSLTLETGLPRLDGATALYPLYAAFAGAVYPEKDYSPYKESEVVCNTTPYAYQGLMEGRADIIFVAGPSEEQLAEAKRLGVELVFTPIGREAFVFFVNAKNGITGLTTGQIQGIYSGEITNWQEVGGRNERIRAFQRPENSGSQTTLQKLMAGKPLMVPLKEDVASGMGEIIERTVDYRNYKNAVGYSFRFFATEMVKNDQIRLLEVDGVYPDRDNIQNGTYPLAAEFYAVTTKNNANPNVDSLIEWILSPQGQELVEKTGYTAINRE